MLETFEPLLCDILVCKDILTGMHSEMRGEIKKAIAKEFFTTPEGSDTANLSMWKLGKFIEQTIKEKESGNIAKQVQHAAQVEHKRLEAQFQQAVDLRVQEELARRSVGAAPAAMEM